jgi:hypothetical protein
VVVLSASPSNSLDPTVLKIKTFPQPLNCELDSARPAVACAALVAVCSIQVNAARAPVAVSAVQVKQTEDQNTAQQATRQKNDFVRDFFIFYPLCCFKFVLKQTPGMKWNLKDKQIIAEATLG